jgi:putative transposase
MPSGSSPSRRGARNRRNGYGKKTVITDAGQIELEVPRDRQARFDPQLIAKYQRRFPGFDDNIISMVCPRYEHP